MEKEQILSTLNERLEAEGIKTNAFQRTFSNYIDEYLPEEGSEPDEAYWNKHLKVLRSISGQFSHDVAAQVEEFKKNYKPQTIPPANKGGKDEKSDLEKRLEQLENAQKESARKASANAVRSEVSAKAKSLKVANEAIWEDAVKAVEIGENESADEVTAKAKKIYESKLRRYMGEGAAPYGSSGRQGANKVAEEEAKEKRDAFKKRMQKRGILPKKE